MCVVLLAIIKEYAYNDKITWKQAQEKLAKLFERIAGETLTKVDSYAVYYTPLADQLEKSLF